MEVILDELRRNDVDIDMTTLSYNINYLLEQHIVYKQLTSFVNPGDLTKIFNEMNVTHSGHALAYLALVYVMNCSEDVTRRAVQLVAVPLKSLTVLKIEKSFFRKMISYLKSFV